MNGFLGSVIASALAGMGGTGFGAAAAIAIVGLFKKPNIRSGIDNIIKLAMSFSGGLMLSIIFFDLMPESFEYASVAAGLVSMITGCITIPVFELAARLMGLPFAMEESIAGGGKKPVGYGRTAILVGVGIALHNFPEGLAIGSGFAGDFGIVLAAIIALHDIPEGIAMAVPLIACGRKPLDVIAASVIAGIPTVLGGIAGWCFAGISEAVIGACLGYAGGAMLYVVMGQLLPICYRDDGPKGIVTSILAGMLAGLLIIHAF